MFWIKYSELLFCSNKTGMPRLKSGLIYCNCYFIDDPFKQRWKIWESYNMLHKTEKYFSRSNNCRISVWVWVFQLYHKRIKVMKNNFYILRYSCETLQPSINKIAYYHRDVNGDHRSQWVNVTSISNLQFHSSSKNILLLHPVQK